MWRILTQNRNIWIYTLVIKVNQTIPFPLRKLWVTKWSLVHCTAVRVVGTREDWTASHLSTAKKQTSILIYDFRKYLRYINRRLLGLNFILCQNKRDGSGSKAGVILTKNLLTLKKSRSSLNKNRFTITLVSQANEITQINRRKITKPICSINWKVICCSLLSSGRDGLKYVQWQQETTRGQAKGVADSRQQWLFSLAGAPALESGNQWRSRPPPESTRIYPSEHPSNPTASVWWCASGHLQKTQLESRLLIPCTTLVTFVFFL